MAKDKAFMDKIRAEDRARDAAREARAKAKIQRRETSANPPKLAAIVTQKETLDHQNDGGGLDAPVQDGGGDPRHQKDVPPDLEEKPVAYGLQRAINANVAASKEIRPRGRVEKRVPYGLEKAINANVAEQAKK